MCGWNVSLNLHDSGDEVVIQPITCAAALNTVLCVRACASSTAFIYKAYSRLWKLLDIIWRYQWQWLACSHGYNPHFFIFCKEEQKQANNSFMHLRPSWKSDNRSATQQIQIVKIYSIQLTGAFRTKYYKWHALIHAIQIIRNDSIANVRKGNGVLYSGDVWF
jgi:hypothetical protein